MIVAMEMEIRLRDLGYRVLGPAGSVHSALDLLGERTPDAALLDVQLGNERVTPVAHQLRSMGVKFALVTGYARLMLPEPELQDVPRLSKPVAQRELEGTLRQLVEGT